MSIKFLGTAAAVIALVAVGVWLARDPAPATIVVPGGEAVREVPSEGPSPETISGGTTPPATPQAAETGGNAQGGGLPPTGARDSAPPVTATRGASPAARPPTAVTRGASPAARPPATATTGAAPSPRTQPATPTGEAPPPSGPAPGGVIAVATPAAGPPPAEATPPAGALPASGTPATPAAVGAGLAVDRPAIQQLLDRYVAAYSRMDERSLKAIDPSFRGIARRELIKSVTLTLGPPVIDLAPDGQSAKLRATGEFRYVWNRAGLPPTSPAQWTWSLRKVGTTWTVVP